MSAQTLNIFAFAATVFGSCLGIGGALMQANAYYPSCDVGGRFCSGRPFFGRAAVCCIQYQAESPPKAGSFYRVGKNSRSYCTTLRKTIMKQAI
jgi:hypothetical protein